MTSLPAACAKRMMIRFADVKAAAVLADAGILAGQLPSAHGSWAKGAPLVASVSVMLSAQLALYTLAPRRQLTTAWSLHYYDHVARRYGDDPEAFTDAWVMAAADEDAFEQAVVGQIWAANLGDYIRWRNQHARPKSGFAINSKIRHPDYPVQGRMTRH